MKDICIHCDREIVWSFGVWVDEEATGDDDIWRETCPDNEDFVALHEPEASDDQNAREHKESTLARTRNSLDVGLLPNGGLF